MDLLTDNWKLHEKHSYKLDTIVDNIGEELQWIEVTEQIQSALTGFWQK